MAEIATDRLSFSGRVREAWDGGGIVDMRLDATRPVNGWEVTVDVGGEIVNIWNARVLGREGALYRLGPLDYNTQLAAGAVADIGVQIEGTPRFAPVGADAVLASDVAEGVAPPPPPAPPSDTGPATLTGTAAPRQVEAQGGGLGTDAQTYAPSTLSFRESAPDGSEGVRVSGVTVPEPAGSGEGLPGDDFAPGPFSTRGATIIDAAGDRAVIHGTNWFGLETDISTVHGLWARNWRAIMDEIKALGFNALRVPFSGELVLSGGGTPSGIDFTLNPDLEGLNGLQILDAVVDYADTIGLRILLDYHRGPAGDGPNDNGLWYGDGYTEADVISVWQTMARRYGDKPAVIGADLVNEPYMGTWGDGSATDWAAAAERIGSAVQAVAPQWLIVVEGIGNYNGDDYWWGGNLQGVRDRPLELPVGNKLVYSPHDYPASVHPQDWFFDGTNLIDKFRENWGFIAEQGIAPVLIGEWGSRLQSSEDLVWARDLTRYIEAHDIAWMWWSLNPNSGDTGGIFLDDWTTVRRDVSSLLEPFLSHTRPENPFPDGADGAAAARFVVTLAEPSVESTVVKFATTDGTARAGEDYVATSGTLLFPPGEVEQVVNVPILPDTKVEGDEFFYLVLGGSGGLSASGTAVITDNDAARGDGALPFVDVAGTVVASAEGAARFRVILSEPAPQSVTLSFTAGLEGAARADMVRGDVVIPQGAREATLELSVPNLGPTSSGQRYVLTLDRAEGAVVREGSAIGLVAAAPPAAAEIAVAAGPVGEAALTIDLVLENDWGTGALFNVIIKNVSDTPVEAWQLSIDLPFDLTELWSAVLVSDEGERVTIKNAAYNGQIAPGETVDFGFIGDGGDIALDNLLAASDLELAVR